MDTDDHRVDEEWRVVPNWEKYEVSNFGRLRKTSTKRIVKPDVCHGHFRYALHDHARTQKTKKMFAHTIVALTFIGPIPEGLTVNHKDGIKTNNVPENLEYVSRGDNARHAVEMGLSGRRFSEHRWKLSDTEANTVAFLARRGVPHKMIQKQFGIAQPTVSRIKNNIDWGDLNWLTW